MKERLDGRVEFQKMGWVAKSETLIINYFNEKVMNFDVTIKV